MLRIILCLVLVLALCSCEKWDEVKSLIPFLQEKPLEILHSEQRFFIHPENNPDYVSVEGIWLITSDHDKVLEQYDYPYGIKIACSRNTDHCSFQKTMIALLKYSDLYYLTTNESDFKIETWNKDAIIAINRFDSGLLGDCFIHILQINFHTQEVFVKSVLKNNSSSDKYCSSYKGKPMPIVRKLVDISESPWEYSISLTRKTKRK